MVYFDTNVLVYIFAIDTDTQEQRDISIKLFDKGFKKLQAVSKVEIDIR